MEASSTGRGPGTAPGPVAPPTTAQNGGPTEPPAPAPPPEQLEPARAEVTEPTEKKLTIRGIEFTLPPKQPFRAISAARGVIAAERRGDNNAAVVALIDIAEAYIGPAQMEQIQDLDSEAGIEIVKEIVQEANKLYGMAEGESSASPSS